jgi:hypothetical protein
MHTKETLSFDEWYDQLCKELKERGHEQPVDLDTAKADYAVGMTVDASAESFEDEWIVEEEELEDGDIPGTGDDEIEETE